MSAPVFASPYAVNLDLAGRSVLVVGGGPVATRKVAGLLRAGAEVTVVAPEAEPEIANDPDVRWFARPYRRGEVASYRLAITATDDPSVNAQVARDGESANVFVNSADDPTNCSFILPAVVNRGDVTVAVSTNGRSPAMAAWLRRQAQQLVTDTHAHMLDVVSEVRDEVRAVRGTSEVPEWDNAINEDLYALIATGDVERARQQLRAALGLSTPGANDLNDDLAEGSQR